MQRNLVIFVIIIVLFFVLALFGFAIWWAQNGFPRGRRREGTASSTSDGEA